MKTLKTLLLPVTFSTFVVAIVYHQFHMIPLLLAAIIAGIGSLLLRGPENLSFAVTLQEVLYCTILGVAWILGFLFGEVSFGVLISALLGFWIVKFMKPLAVMG